VKLPEPGEASPDSAALFTSYLDYFRSEARRKTIDLDESALVTTHVVSGWTPTQLVTHLVHMEQRWFIWGFLGEQVDAPWGDQNADGRWGTTTPLGELLDALDEGGRRTSQILGDHPMETPATPGGRFAEGENLPTLLAICFHVMQEYARHIGHLDIVRELIDGTVGEG